MAVGVSNPYRAKGVPFKPWWTVDHYGGEKIYHGRYWFKWQARLASVGVLKVEYGPDQVGCRDHVGQADAPGLGAPT